MVVEGISLQLSISRWVARSKHGLDCHSQRYWQIPPLKPSPTALGIINPKLDPSVAQNPVTMFIACGPYTADSDLTYRPWRFLLNEITTKKPDVTLLVKIPISVVFSSYPNAYIHRWVLS